MEYVKLSKRTNKSGRITKAAPSLQGGKYYYYYSAKLQGSAKRQAQRELDRAAASIIPPCKMPK